MTERPSSAWGLISPLQRPSTPRHPPQKWSPTGQNSLTNTIHLLTTTAPYSNYTAYADITQIISPSSTPIQEHNESNHTNTHKHNQHIRKQMEDADKQTHKTSPQFTKSCLPADQEHVEQLIASVHRDNLRDAGDLNDDNGLVHISIGRLKELMKGKKCDVCGERAHRVYKRNPLIV